jgi:phosphatidylglycerol lysyltransferase
VRGVALVVGSPFGDPGHVPEALDGFLELCFVNDWLPAFIHVDPAHRELYTQRGFRLQKIGEEAVLDLDAFAATARDKHFRNIRNRFEKQDCRVELVQPPHSDELLMRLSEISAEWLARPGRAERGFMMGPYSAEYMQQCTLALLYDVEGVVQGFMNLLPTHTPAAANYDLLRVAANAPGNASDYLVMELAGQLQRSHVHHLNLGLSPLAGVDKPDNDESTLVDRALRFAYSNGDRLYSFSGLHRFKAKFRPNWEARYIAYQGGVGNFTRILTALNRAMRMR